MSGRLRKPTAAVPWYYFVGLETGPPLAATLAANVLLAGLFFLFYFIGLFWAPVAFAIVYTVHVSAIWLYLLYEMFGAEWRLGKVSGIRILALYAVTILQYAFWHSIVMLSNSFAFVGIPPDASLGRKFLLSLFVSVESVSSLGSGAIIASSDGSFVSVGFNAVHGTLFLVLAVPMLLAIFFENSNVRRNRGRRMQ